jgi:hypothetical protein
MTGKEFELVNDVVECEGFDYGFVNYTSFDEIKDKEFHRLRKKFLKARENLTNYCGIED